MKKLTVRQFASIKRIAQNVNPLVVKKNKIDKEFAELLAAREILQNEINGHEAGVQALTGGYVSEQLVKKIVETTDKVDKDGNPVKVTKYLPTDIVTYDEEENCYYINEAKTEEYETNYPEVKAQLEAVETVSSEALSEDWVKAETEQGADNDIDNI